RPPPPISTLFPYTTLFRSISPFQRAAVEDGISDVRIHQDLITAQVDSRIFGQHLSYVGSYQFQKIHARNMSPTNSDMGNILPGIDRKSTRLNSSHLVISYA